MKKNIAPEKKISHISQFYFKKNLLQITDKSNISKISLYRKRK